MAVAKEAIAYQVLEQFENPDSMSLDDIADFNNKASDAVDTYNKYLVNKANAAEVDQVNNKIAEINQKIKEYTDIYDNRSAENEQQVQEEMNDNQQENDNNNPDENNEEPAPENND